MKITFLIPALNEEEGIATTIGDLPLQAIEERGWDVEILVIDGDSTDNTRAVAEGLGAKVVNEPRRGYGRAYKTGFANATGDIIVTGDADGTYLFEESLAYIDRLTEDAADFLTCDRYGHIEDGAMRGLHRLGNGVLSTTTRCLFGVRLRDSQSGMWIIRRSALAKLPIDALPEGMAFSQEIKVEALKRKDVNAAEIPSGLRSRVGEAKIESWRDGFGNLKALFKKRLTTRW